MEKNMKKNIYIHVTESLCWTPGTNNTINQLHFNKIKTKQNMVTKGKVGERDKSGVQD